MTSIFRYMAVALVALVLLPGCRKNSLSTKLDNAVERKASIDERIIDWGAPDSKAQLSDGRMVFTWKKPWTSSQVHYAAPTQQVYTAQHLCTIVITTSAESIIESYNYRDC